MFVACIQMIHLKRDMFWLSYKKIMIYYHIFNLQRLHMDFSSENFIYFEFLAPIKSRKLYYLVSFSFLPRSHIHGSPRQSFYGLNLTDDPGNANFRRPIRMHYIRMIKYYYVWLRMQYGKLRTNTDCYEWCRIVSVANPASSAWMCDLGIK